MLSSNNTSPRSQEESLDLVFRALGDQTRRRMLARLAEGSAMVTELAEPFDMSLPAVSKHLRVLENAGLVKRTVNGRIHNCVLEAIPLMGAGSWINHYQRFWGESLDALGDYFENSNEKSA